jgi:uncharacterized damage-inducible protein DinB
MKEHIQLLARYNRLANEQLYEACAALSDEQYREQRRVSFGSIHGLLNHILLADRIWMGRFKGGGKTTPPLNTVLFEKFEDLRGARVRDDREMGEFFASVDGEFFAKTISYVNSRGQAYTDPVLPSVLHMFNHQTHHRGQVHVMLSQAGLQPPSLDMHRLLKA